MRRSSQTGMAAGDLAQVVEEQVAAQPRWLLDHPLVASGASARPNGASMPLDVGSRPRDLGPGLCVGQRHGGAASTRRSVMPACGQ